MPKKTCVIPIFQHTLPIESMLIKHATSNNNTWQFFNARGKRAL